jgi:hypothetical protein
MSELFEHYAPRGGSYALPLVAAQIIEKLRRDDPRLLASWLDDNAQRFIYEALVKRDGHVRRESKERAKRRVFHSASGDGGGETDEEQLESFLDVPFLSESGTKPLGKMTGADLKFAVGKYERRSVDNRMTAAFLEALANQVAADQMVEEVLDEDQVRHVYHEFVGVKEEKEEPTETGDEEAPASA